MNKCLKNRIIVKAPATSANLSVGFDVLGLCFDFYNEFSFSLSDNDQLTGFEKRYSKAENNLVLTAFSYVFSKAKIARPKISITLLKQNVPPSRGLGSSSTCVCAGVLAAAKILNISDEKFILECCAQLENHPDNACACLHGGLTACAQINDKYEFVNYPVSDKLIFLIIVPQAELKTQDSRAALKKEYTLSEITHNSCRLALLQTAFSTGNAPLISELFDDYIAEPYRLPLIRGGENIKNATKECGAAFAISGAGSSMLAVLQNDCDCSPILLAASKEGFDVLKPCVGGGAIVL